MVYLYQWVNISRYFVGEIRTWASRSGETVQNFEVLSVRPFGPEHSKRLIKAPNLFYTIKKGVTSSTLAQWLIPFTSFRLHHSYHLSHSTPYNPCSWCNVVKYFTNLADRDFQYAFFISPTCLTSPTHIWWRSSQSCNFLHCPSDSYSSVPIGSIGWNRPSSTYIQNRR